MTLYAIKIDSHLAHVPPSAAAAVTLFNYLSGADLAAALREDYANDFCRTSGIARTPNSHVTLIANEAQIASAPLALGAHGLVTCEHLMEKLLQQYQELDAELERLEMAHAKGEDLPHHAARMLALDALMENSPFTRDHDEGIILKSEASRPAMRQAF